MIGRGHSDQVGPGSFAVTRPHPDRNRLCGQVVGSGDAHVAPS